MNFNPIIVVGGEPYSIFLELFFKVYSSRLIKTYNRPLILIASKKLILNQMKILGYKFKINLINQKILSRKILNNQKINLIDVNLNYKNKNNKISFKSKKYINECFDLALKLFLLVTVPVILGMLLRRFVSNVALKFEPFAKKISIFLFILVLIGAIAAERENIISYFSQAGLITLVLNVVMMIVAYYLAQTLASGKEQKKCITIECGLQNGTLAIFVATSIFGGGMYVIPAAPYSLIMFITSLVFVYLVKRSRS